MIRVAVHISPRCYFLSTHVKIKARAGVGGGGEPHYVAPDPGGIRLHRDKRDRGSMRHQVWFALDDAALVTESPYLHVSCKLSKKV